MTRVLLLPEARDTSRMRLQEFFELTVRHILFATVAAAARRHDVISCVTPATRSRQLMLSLKFYILCLTVGAGMIVFFQDGVPLSDSQSIRQASNAGTATALVVVAALGIGAPVVALIFQQLVSISRVVGLVISAFPLSSFGRLIACFVNGAHMLGLSLAPLAFIVSMVFKHIGFSIAASTEPTASMLGNLIARLAADIEATAIRLLSKTGLAQATFKRLTELSAGITNNSFWHLVSPAFSPCKYTTAGIL